MAVPTHYMIMLPLLRYLAEGNPRHGSDAIQALDAYFQLSDEERNELVPSGKKTRFVDRVHWAATYLRQAGLIESAGRGYWQITDEGQRAASSGLSQINRAFLMQYPTFADFRARSSQSGHAEPEVVIQDQTPEELIASAHGELNQQLAVDLLEHIQSQSPRFFEELVLDLLKAMGYGGLGNAERVGQTGDGGIDGVINEDKLGLDSIYIQAKRWSGNSIGSAEIRAFVGSLVGVGATKGVFITTSSFSQQAMDQAKRATQFRIVLIDGTQLANLMIEHNVGVTTQKTYNIKRVDYDYFPSQ